MDATLEEAERKLMHFMYKLLVGIEKGSPQEDANICFPIQEKDAQGDNVYSDDDLI